MRVGIIALGSTGDVLPFAGLGQALAEAGHVVTIAAHAGFEDPIQDAGLTGVELPLNPRNVDSDVQAQIRKGGITALRAITKSYAPHGQAIAEKIDDVAGDSDVLLYSTLAWPSYVTAQAHGIPSFGLDLQPMEPTRAFPALMAPFSLGPAGNRFLARQGQRLMFGTGIPLVNVIRAGHGLPPTTPRKLVRELADRDQPILCGFSRHIVPRPADWRGGIDLTGFWWPPAPRDFTPPPHLVDFLAAGDRPVFVGFGSMWVKDKDETGSLIRAALRTSGKRAVVQAGWAGLEIDDENVCMIGDVPHAWLFPQMAAAVHHAGAGTMAAALRAGIPSVPVPQMMDQPFWASRVAALGAACVPIPARQLTASRLVAALTEVTSVPSYRVRSGELGELVRGEDGHARVVDRIAALEGTHNYTPA
jgi:sterol 3beta-glucosyltransferase